VVTIVALVDTTHLRGREAFDSFAQERIRPITAEVGIPGPPKMSFFEAHSHMG
jgi:hypothetical protein